MPRVLDEVRETVSLQYTDQMILLGKVDGFESFSDYLYDQDIVLYSVKNYKGVWESGVALYVSTTNTLIRQRVISSSNGDDAVVFPQGNQIITSALDGKIIEQLLDLIPYPYW